MAALDRLVQFASDPAFAERIQQTQAYMRCRYMDAVILEMLSDAMDAVEEVEWEIEVTPDDMEALIGEDDEEDDDADLD